MNTYIFWPKIPKNLQPLCDKFDLFLVDLHSQTVETGEKVQHGMESLLMFLHTGFLLDGGPWLNI